MNYATKIATLFSGLTSAEDDRLWNAWLDLSKKREPRELQTLLTADVRKGFKARALTILMAPDLLALPFRWDDTGRSYLSLDFVEVEMLSPELVRFAGELVCHNVDYVLGQNDASKRESLLVKYRRLILKLLAVLPEDDDLASRIFSRCQINESIAYSNMEDSSGYNPLYSILTSGVPVKWKELADKQMRARIVAEFEGREYPRKPHEEAIRCYAQHIQSANYDGKESYPRKLFVSQIRFITELPKIEAYTRKLFDCWQVVHIFSGLAGDDNRAIRHKLARLIVISNTEEYSRFSVFNTESRRAADLMLREFGAEDKELAMKLNTLIADADKSEADESEKKRLQQQKVATKLNQMK